MLTISMPLQGVLSNQLFAPPFSVVPWLDFLLVDLLNAVNAAAKMPTGPSPSAGGAK
jgi:hypothetical protein